MKHATTKTLIAAPQQPKKMKKRSISPTVLLRKELRNAAKYIAFLSQLNLFAGFCCMTLLGILDSYIKDFITGMERLGSINIGISSTVAAFSVFTLGCAMGIFSLFLFVTLNLIAQSLRTQANKLTEEE